MVGGGDPLTGWFNTAAFQRPAGRGDFGNAPRNAVQRPGFNNWNLAVFKNVAVGGRRVLQFRWEIYNVLDTVQFQRHRSRRASSTPQGVQTKATFGTALGIAIAHRAAAHDAALGPVHFLERGTHEDEIALVCRRDRGVWRSCSAPRRPHALSPQPFGDQPPARL